MVFGSVPNSGLTRFSIATHPQSLLWAIVLSLMTPFSANAAAQDLPTYLGSVPGLFIRNA